MNTKQIKHFIEAIKANNQMIADYQRNVIKALAEAIKLSNANTKLPPADVWTMRVVLALQEPESKDPYPCKDDPYVHVHGIC